MESKYEDLQEAVENNIDEHRVMGMEKAVRPAPAYYAWYWQMIFVLGCHLWMICFVAFSLLSIPWQPLLVPFVISLNVWVYMPYRRMVFSMHDCVFVFLSSIYVLLFLVAECIHEYHVVLCGYPILSSVLLMHVAFIVQVAIWSYLDMGLSYCYSSQPAWYSVIVLYLFGWGFFLNSLLCTHHFNIYDRCSAAAYGYFWLLVWMPALGATFYAIVPWEIWVILPQIAFVILIRYLYRQREQIFHEEEQQRVFHLTTPNKLTQQITSYQKSLQVIDQKKKPLPKCKKCSKNTATYFYEKCLHVCLCGECLVDVLGGQPGVLSCWICNKPSQRIFQMRNKNNQYYKNRYVIVVGYKM